MAVGFLEEYMTKWLALGLLLLVWTVSPVAAQNSLFIDDLTWMEVDAAIKAGKTTALVVAGGMEQNGPHMAMGKHVAIARYMGEHVAKELGNALVFPIMPFAPAGDPADAKSGMMKYPGNVSISEESLGSVMRDLALSAITAGFKNVVIMGDHGGGQATLKTVAGQLDEKYRAKGVRVYFSDHGYGKARDEFIAYAKTKGIAAGGHASLQDTSEILYLKPEWIRKDKINLAAESNGVVGDPRPSTKELGKIYLDYKVRNAVEQIRGFIGAKSATGSK